MRTKFKKRIAIAICVFMSAVLLAGCGNSSTAPAENTAAESSAVAAEPVTATPAALPEVTIKMYMPGAKPNNFDAVWANIEKASKDTLNAKFDLQYMSWADYGDKLKVLIASGDSFDMAFDADWFNWPTLVKNGSLMELDSLMDSYAPNLKAYLQNSGALEWAKVDGKIVAVPNDDVILRRSYAVIREDIRKKYNLSDNIKTIEDVNKFIEDVLAKEKFQYPISKSKINGPHDDAGFAMMTKYGYDVQFMTNNFGYVFELSDSSCKVVPFEETQAFKEASALRRDWYTKGYFTKNAINSENSDNKWENGSRLVMLSTQNEAFVALSDSAKEQGIELKAYPLYSDSKAAFSSTTGNLFEFNKKAMNPERAMMFLEWANASQENYDAVLYGIKGTSYDLVKSDYGDKEAVAYVNGETADNSYVSAGGHWAFWRQQWLRAGVGDSSGLWLFKGKDDEKKDTNAIVTPLAGFSFNTEAVKAEIAKRQAVMSEQGKALEFGLVADVDKGVADYIAAQKAAGSDKIREELQKQIDAFLAAKK